MLFKNIKYYFKITQLWFIIRQAKSKNWLQSTLEWQYFSGSKDDFRLKMCNPFFVQGNHKQVLR